MYIFLCIILGLVLRLVNIVKPEGLWNDEYVSWYIASTPFHDGFWDAILKQCHVPVYYLYLKPFAHLSDTMLRMTSVIPSLLAIYVMYLLGKEFSGRTAKIAAIITAILPFLVYYSQEVRFYSLVFLLSAIVLLFAVKIIKESNYKNILSYCIASVILSFTHVLGIIYVILLSLYLAYKKRIYTKKIITGLVLLTVIVIPFGLNIIKQLNAAQWWGIFSYTNIMFLFSDYLSPVLSNHVNAPPVFYYSHNILFNFMLTVPAALGLTGIVTGAKKTKGFLAVSTVFIIILSILAVSGKLVFITKYTTEILPVLILTVSAGFSGDGKFKRILLISFILLNLSAVFLPFYPSKLPRSEGNNLPSAVLNVQKPDLAVFTYYAPDRFGRYLKIKPKTAYINKTNRGNHKTLIPEIINNANHNDKVSVVFLDSVSFVPENVIENGDTKNIPEMFITFSQIKHNFQKQFSKNFRNVKLVRIGSWSVLSGTKI